MVTRENAVADADPGERSQPWPNRRLAVLVFALLVVIGCGKESSPAAPTPVVSSNGTPAGRWVGAVADPVSGDGTLQLELSEQSANAYVGTWSVAFRNGERYAGHGVANQIAQIGYGIILYVEPPPACIGSRDSAAVGFTLVNVAITSTTLTASLGRTSCNGPSLGTISLSLQ